MQPSLPEVFADKVQIEQVVLNLIRNAVEAMVHTPPTERRLAIRTEHKGEFVLTTICDSGHGMTEQQLSQLFTPFASTKRCGMGLGVTVSKSIIDAHDGTLSVESQLGVGTQLCFAIPLATAET